MLVNLLRKKLGSGGCNRLSSTPCKALDRVLKAPTFQQMEIMCPMLVAEEEKLLATVCAAFQRKTTPKLFLSWFQTLLAKCNYSLC